METYNFTSNSLSRSPIGEKIASILNAAIESVNPEKAVKRFLFRDRDLLQIQNHHLDLTQFKNIYVIGFGKASIPMTTAVLDIIGDLISDCIVITKARSNHHYKNCLVNHKNNFSYSLFTGTHPVPSSKNVFAVDKVVQLLTNTTMQDLVIILISGGGSSILTYPVEGISLEDLQILTASLLKCGADIQEINCLRKHLSSVKGGCLARIASPAKVISLILSDVIGDPLDVIASGPTSPDPTTFNEAYSILEKYQILDKQTNNVLSHLLNGIVGKGIETPKIGDPIFDNVINIVIANNETSANAALKQAESDGFYTSIITTCLQGEARDMGKILAGLAHQILINRKSLKTPICFIAGGETIVTVTGNGFGGRNQELALSMVRDLSNLPSTLFLSLATDGEDGPTDASGAVVTGETLSRGNKLGLDPDLFLDNNDSYNYFSPLGDLLITGPTFTNVCDLSFIISF